MTVGTGLDMYIETALEERERASDPSADVSILPRVALPRVAIQFRDAVLMKC